MRNDKFLNELNNIQMSAIANNDNVIKTFGKLLCYYYRTKIKSNAISLYADLRVSEIKNIDELSKIERVIEYQTHLDMLKTICTDENLQMFCELYNLNSSDIKKHFQSQDKYLRVKFGKVIQNYFNGEIPEDFKRRMGLNKFLVK